MGALMKNRQDSTDQPVSVNRTHICLSEGLHKAVPSTKVMWRQGFLEVKSWNGITALHFSLGLELLLVSPEKIIRVDKTAVDGWTVQPLYACRTLCVQFSLLVWPARLQ